MSRQNNLMGKNSSERLRVKVIKHLPLGLSVELENGKQGIIRVREISWDQETRLNWKQYHPVNSEAWAVPIQMKAGYPSELSLRLAENDPWANISSHFGKNKIYTGVVTGVMGYGAFVELASGVTGLLHESKLPAWVQKSPLELFWPGDRVRVGVEQVDAIKRRLGLGLPTEKSPAFSASQFSSDSIDARRQAEIDALINDKSNRKRILVVEDDPDQAKLVSSWLVHVGQKVNIVRHGEEALSSLAKFSPDIVFIDVGLPGMDGIALANELLEKYPHLRLVITTEYASADERNGELDSLQERGVDFLIKPLIPDDMLDFLKKNGNHVKQSPIVANVSSEGSLIDSETSPTRSLRLLLQKCRVRLGFDAAILFRLDAVRRTVSIVESSTQLALNNYSIPSLIYSPVRDIAEDEEIIVREKCLNEDEARFQYLLDLFPMQACIGVPVQVSLPQKYALLFLNSQAKDIYEEDQTYAEAVSLTVGSYLEQNLFREKSTLIQRYALIGQLTTALVHEINNLMGPLNNRLEIFKNKLEGFKNNETYDDKTTFLKKDLGDIQQAIHKIVTTMRMLGRVITKDKHEILRLDEIVTETIGLMRDTADREHIALAFTPPEKLLLVRSQSAAMQQILLNLLLNAIQQISEFRSGRGGAVQISLELASTTTPNNAVRILVKDNGPGIHTSLWDTIFELGYSTRQDGSGIGLYISKSLAEEKLKGRLFVLESYILGGTTVALEIPHRL
jgi:signal transduction histidine kinase/predicted RNA-binding protein with RPS1 domain/ActR/RegA family two-component response regulator